MSRAARQSTVTRREALQATALSTGAVLAYLSRPDFLFAGQDVAETLVPFLDMPRARPGILDWETLDAWLTPQDQVFNVSHYNVPDIKPAEYRLEITGLVDQPRTLTLEEVKARPRSEQLMTLECSGNGSSKGFMGAVYNSRWTGTRLAPLLAECGIQLRAVEVAFIGYDQQKETLRKGTPREVTFEVPFGRSMSVADVLRLDPLLAYERNGEPLTQGNGAPLRLIVPGWYGIANVKWLRRIELRDTRYMGRFMARDYVTVRGERRGEDIVYVETSVSKMNLKSIIARITRKPAVAGRIPCKAYGAVWSDGTEIRAVEVQVDGGEWRPATLDQEPRAKYCWTFFSIDLGELAPGKHRVVSRAIDVNGRVQPTADDDEIALKKTYWEAYAQWPRDIELTEA
uniref:Sulfite oxidase n=1 Tax=Schlesneria paludicola TaxID=360056 RepID=A0A7C4LMH9_9PLAN